MARCTGTCVKHRQVDGKPKMISERYLGSAKDIEALLDTLGTRHRKLVETAEATGAVEVTVVFDAGQNSAASFTRVTDT